MFNAKVKELMIRVASSFMSFAVVVAFNGSVWLFGEPQLPLKLTK